MTSNLPTSKVDAATPTDQYVQGVRDEIRQLQAYFAKRITMYRAAQAIVIVSAALVPVLAAADSVPRWVLGALGALAAAVEGLQGLYQLRRSALNAMRAANAEERELNKYMTAVPPYEEQPDQAFNELAKRIEAIREATDEAFLHTWSATEPRQAIAK